MTSFFAAAWLGVGIPAALSYIVIFDDNADEAWGESDRLTRSRVISRVRSFGGEVHHQYSFAIQGFAATLPDAAVEALREMEGIAYIEADQVVTVEQDASAYQCDNWALARIESRQWPQNQSPYTFSTTELGAACCQASALVSGRGSPTKSESLSEGIKSGFSALILSRIAI